jgi:hypothetical protein
VLFVSHLIWATVERPVRQYMLSLFPKRKALPAGAPRAVAAVVPVAVSAGGGEAGVLHPSEPPPPTPPRRLQTLLETPGEEAGARSWFRPFLEPSFRIVLFDLAAIALLVAGTLTWAYWPRTRPATGYALQHFAAVLDEAAPASKNALFGQEYRLRGATIERLGNHLNVSLVWEALTSSRLRYTVAFHVLGADGRMISQTQVPLDVLERHSVPHDLWRMRATVYFPRNAHPAALGIMLFYPAGSLPVSDAPTNWSGHRLVIPLPAPTDRPTASSAATSH